VYDFVAAPGERPTIWQISVVSEVDMNHLEIRRKQQFALQELIACTLSVEDALVIASMDRQQMAELAKNHLLDYEEKGKLDAYSQGWRLAEFVWQTAGISHCIRFVFHSKYGVYENFMFTKLALENDRFSDEDLEILVLNEPRFKESAESIRRDRMRSDIETLKRQGAEFTNDIATVKQRVSDYSFNTELNQLLDKVDQELLKQSDAFDAAATIKHVRTFYEKLQLQVACTLRDKKSLPISDADLGKNIRVLAYFKQHRLLTAKMHDFSNSLYGVLSNEGVHAIKSTQEYVRLCRNMVAEYALILFFELDRWLK